MAKTEEDIVQSGNEAWRGAKAASDAAKIVPKIGAAKSADETHRTTRDGQDVSKRGGRSSRPAKTDTQ